MFEEKEVALIALSCERDLALCLRLLAQDYVVHILLLSKEFEAQVLHLHKEKHIASHRNIFLTEECDNKCKSSLLQAQSLLLRKELHLKKLVLCYSFQEKEEATILYKWEGTKYYYPYIGRKDEFYKKDLEIFSQRYLS